MKDEHNHDLMPRVYQNSDPKLQFIPDHYWNRAIELRYGHQSWKPTEIYKLFCQEERGARRGQLTFTRLFLKNKLEAFLKKKKMQFQTGSTDGVRRPMDEQQTQPGFILDVERLVAHHVRRHDGETSIATERSAAAGDAVGDSAIYSYTSIGGTMGN